MASEMASVYIVVDCPVYCASFIFIVLKRPIKLVKVRSEIFLGNNRVST